jgi:hypothetical protein
MYFPKFPFLFVPRVVMAPKTYDLTSYPVIHWRKGHIQSSTGEKVFISSHPLEKIDLKRSGTQKKISDVRLSGSHTQDIHLKRTTGQGLKVTSRLQVPSKHQ